METFDVNDVSVSAYLLQQCSLLAADEPLVLGLCLVEQATADIQVPGPNGYTTLSVAHYGEQNGDPMADPEMTFTIVGGEYYPISFRNDYVGLYQEVFRYDEDGRPEAIDKKLQSDLTAFANQWMKNIQEQQGI